MCWAELSELARPERIRGHQNACQADLQAQLGASKLHSKRNLEPLGRHLALQTGLQAQLGASWAQLGSPRRTLSATWRL